jgi:hypothetical protein
MYQKMVQNGDFASLTYAQEFIPDHDCVACNESSDQCKITCHATHNPDEKPQILCGAETNAKEKKAVYRTSSDAISELISAYGGVDQVPHSAHEKLKNAKEMALQEWVEAQRMHLGEYALYLAMKKQ